jgi:hypothetical protein
MYSNAPFCIYLLGGGGGGGGGESDLVKKVLLLMAKHGFIFSFIRYKVTSRDILWLHDMI